LRVTGFIRCSNKAHIHLGSNVTLKRQVELLAGQRDKAITIGDRSGIHEFCVLQTFPQGFIHIGRRSNLNRNGLIYGAGGVTIGDRVRIGAGVNIVSHNHVFDDPDVPIMDQGQELSPIVIEDDVWMGVRVTVLPGVTIGLGSVVGAGSVVTRDVPPHAVVAGVPARRIGDRGQVAP
ncbi:MAG: acyltransferase, partial [Chloroflexota bacterium]